MNLFQLGNFQLASGNISKWKIDCDALTKEDWECLAYMASLILPKFGKVEGVPRGGLKFAEALEKYIDPNSNMLLIAEDVVTTGKSIEKFRNNRKAIGIAVFSRGMVPYWVEVLFRVGNDQRR